MILDHAHVSCICMLNMAKGTSSSSIREKSTVFDVISHGVMALWKENVKLKM